MKPAETMTQTLISTTAALQQVVAHANVLVGQLQTARTNANNTPPPAQQVQQLGGQQWGTNQFQTPPNYFVSQQGRF